MKVSDTILKYAGIPIVLLFLFSGCGTARNGLKSIRIRNTAALLEYFSYTGNNVPLISGHRGGMIKGYPENSIATFENTLRYTPAFFEIDPRLTKDSIIILLHDDSLGRTTNGTGKVSDYTWAELQKLRLKDPEGNVTNYGIPTLDEVIKWSKGKTILNLDKKDVPLEMTAKKLREHKAEAYVMLTVHNAKQAKFYYEGNKNVMFSAFVLSKEALAEYEQEGIPWSHIIAYIGPRYKPENKELIDMLHARGVKCMISAAPLYDKLKDSADRMVAYREIIKSGADIIESDLPIDVALAIQPLMRAKPSRH